MGTLKTCSPTYCIMDDGENMLNLTHTRQNISDRHFISSMTSDKFPQWWYWDGVLYKQTSTICKPKRIRIFALIVNCTIMMKANSGFPGTYMQYVTEYYVTNISDTQPRKNMITMRQVDTSDLMMIITWAIDISFQSPRTEMGQLNTCNPIYCNESKW